MGKIIKTKRSQILRLKDLLNAQFKNLKLPIPKHIIMKFQNTKNKENIYKSSRK